MPIYTWNYQAEDEGYRHMGPMAQDFYAAFALGYTDTAITTIDSDGVALAAIQGLHQVVQRQKTQIDTQQTQIASLQKAVASMEQRLAAMEAALQKIAPRDKEKEKP